MSDQGGLRGARDAGVRTGGTAPRDWRKDDGAAPWLAEFGLVESQRKSYAARTRANAEAADGTVLFGNPLSAGSALTERCCNHLGRPLLRIPQGRAVCEAEEAAHILAGWETVLTIEVLNVAGNRKRGRRGLRDSVRGVVSASLLLLLTHT